MIGQIKLFDQNTPAPADPDTEMLKMTMLGSAIYMIAWREDPRRVMFETAEFKIPTHAELDAAYARLVNNR